MSFSSQISRGTLALSLLVLFGLLALAANFNRQAQGGVSPVAANNILCETPNHRVSGWRFAQTPADLGNLARPWDSCRA